MQLTNIKSKISLATCSLLQVTASATQAADSEWDIDTGFLYYGESDGRVQAAEPAIYAGRNIGDDGERIDLRLVIDILTGATPNGAHAVSESNGAPQTFTTPSGSGTYTAAAGVTPLDSTFMDTRAAVGADWTLPVNRLSRVKLGLNASAEYDYVSLGVSGSYIRDLNNKNTTLTASLAFNNDTYTPEGGIPIALSPMRVQGAGLNREGSNDTKTITDFLIGVTQVVSRNTLIELNYSYGMSDGYLTDPFKIVSVVDANGKLADSGDFDPVTGNLPYVYENRPDSRQRNNLFFRVAHHLTQDVIHFSYRYFWDDWGISSNTFDLKYRYQMGRSYLQPHVRYYMQEEADFYKHDLTLEEFNSGSVTEVSSDSRLMKFTTATLGLKYGYAISKSSEISVRGELMNQTFDDGDVIAGEETPDLDAIIVNIGYSLVW